MKILHINSNYLLTTLYARMLEIIEKLNVLNTVYMAMNGNEDIVIPIEPFVVASVCFKKNDRYRFFYKQKKIERDIKNKINIISYDVVHAHTLFTDGYVALKMKKSYGIPYIVAVRNTDVNAFFRYLFHLRNVGIKVLEQAEKIIFISGSYKDLVFQKYIPQKYRETLIQKSFVIPNGIDDFWLKNKNFYKTVPTKKDVNLIYVGRIDKNKNITSTIKAIDILEQRGYSIHFTVVGKIENPSVFNQIKSVSCFKYIEPKEKEELIKIYRHNDIFVMPSIKETFGLVYAEAMSQGLPVIYTRGQGFDKQFEEGIAGYSVDCYNPENIANKIELVIKNYKELSDNCVLNCDKFDWNLISRQYIEIYNEISCQLNETKAQVELCV